MELNQEICRLANRIYIAAEFSIASACSKASRRTALIAAGVGHDLLVRVDPFWLRTSYTAITSDFRSDTVVGSRFQTTVGNLLHTIRVHQRPIARLGSSICAWDGTVAPFRELADSLDTMSKIVSGDGESICDFLTGKKASKRRMLALSDAFYGVAVVITGINLPATEPKGFQREIVSAGAMVVLDASRHLTQNAEFATHSKPN